MNVKKRIGMLMVIMMILFSTLTITSGITYAASAAKPNYILGITNVREGIGGAYGLGAKADGGVYKKIWKIVAYPTMSSTTIDDSNAFYCLRAEHGFALTPSDSTDDVTKVKKNYNIKRDMKTQKDDVLARLQAVGTFNNHDGSVNPNADKEYNKIMWVLDNIYLPKQSTEEDKIELLTKAGIISGKDDDYYGHERITEHDIEVVQQLVLWYLTNKDTYYTVSDTKIYPYDRETLDTLLWSSTDSNYDAFNGDEGRFRQDECAKLYKYFIDNANTKSDYVSQDVTSPFVLEKERVTLTEENDNYIIGPFRIKQNSNHPYTLNKLGFTDETGKEFSYTLLDTSKQPVQDNKIESLFDQDFYISVPNTTTISSIKFDFGITYTKTIATYYTTDEATYRNEQPVVLVEKTYPTYEDSVTIPIPAPKSFDLSLRKFISAVNGVAPTVSREPDVDVSGLKAGTSTTAIYNHPKAPLKVEEESMITYTIRVYNEGEKDGYASEITDHLPEELEFLPEDSLNQEYGWEYDTIDSSNRTIKTNYLSKENGEGNLLTAYNGGDTLAYKDIQVKCKLKATTTEGKRIVNIADITEFTSKSGNPIVDRDSQKDNVTLPSDETLPNYKEEEINRGDTYIPGQQDDDDFDNIYIQPKIFDLSLRKFISAVNGVAPTVSREPDVDVSGLKAGTSTTAIYNHPKALLKVEEESMITYTIRVYNEGEKDGYASEITDHLPEELEFLPEDSLNQEYGWEYDETDSSNRTIKTNYLSKKNGEGNLLTAYNGGDTLAYKDIQVKCKLKATTTEGKRIVNIADITGFTDKRGNTVIDRDSQKDNVTLPSDETLPNYKKEEIDRGDTYIPGQQDDDDFDNVYIQPKPFDLALRKFISAVNGVAPTVSREPVVDVSGLKAGTSTTAIYNHPKAPLKVEEESIITYTIRVYNEGEKDGYASEITDHLPEELEFLPEDSLNQEYGWEYDTTDSSNRTIKTDYLSKENGEGNLLTAYNGGDTLAYKDIQVKCKLKATTTEGKRIVNIADITEFTDKRGNTVIDRDSQKDNVTLPSDETLPNYKKEEIDRGDTYIPGQQDDDDFDNVYIQPKPFDLSLRKFISAVNGVAPTVSREPVVDVSGLKAGTSTTAIYNHPKAPLSVEIGDIVTYTIRVYNEGEKDGYVDEITDHLPEQLKFLPEDEANIANGWFYDESDTSLRTIKTEHLSKNTDTDNIIKAYDGGNTLHYKDVTVKCKVVASPTFDKRIVNIADITEFTDKKGNAVIDRDSQKDNVTLPSDETLPNYKEEEINRGDTYIPGQQDDDDFDNVKIVYFDLAVRKFISSINDQVPTVNREPVVDVSGLVAGTSTTAIYNHPKAPLSVQVGDIVTYTIRVYNEGSKDGYATEITDHLPEQLEFLPEDKENIAKGWTYDESDKTGRTIKTNYLSKERNEKNLIKAFDGETLYYKDVTVKCKVTADAKYNKRIVNLADITEFTDSEGNEVKDIDSKKDNVVLPSDEDLPNYKQEEIDRGDTYIPGGEDDDDFDSVKIVYFDLALRKFITKVDDLEVNNRYPELSMTEEGNIKYTHTKEPVSVANGNIVTYTIRVYNEGTMDGYAKEITDDLPEGLLFLPQNETNVTYRWKMIDKDGNETDKVEQAVKITTDYLSKAQEKEKGENLLKAFDVDAGLSDTNPDHKDVKIAFKVTEPNTSDRILINTAEISEDSDKNDKPVIDIDSTPGNDEEGEDDIDIDKVKVKYFDLALKKWVTQAIVIEDGKQTVTETGHTGDENPEPVVKVDLKAKKLNKVTVKFKYKIKVTNEGEIEGYVKELKDYIPDGLIFNPDDNPKWTQVSDKVVTTDQVKDLLLKPGESTTVEITLTWKNSSENLGLKVNWAEISKDYNEYDDTPDIDSTPDNNKPGEDDIDNAPVILAIKTGEARIYFTLTAIILITLAGGIYIIKRFVL